MAMGFQNPAVWLCLLVLLALNPEGMAGEANESCPKHKCGNLTVEYPFYIADSAPAHRSPRCAKLKLHCEHNTTLRLPLHSGRSYTVLNFTSRNVITIDPRGCDSSRNRNLNNRSASSAASFALQNDPNYALSYGNLLMLYGCSNTTGCFNNCNFASRTIHWHGSNVSHRCGSPQCCYDLQFASFEAFMDMDFISSLNCSGFSSMVTRFKEQGEDVSVDAYEGLGLEWSLDERCIKGEADDKRFCAANAKCSNGTFKGHTCICKDGFLGDPYWIGCRPVAAAASGRHHKFVRGSIVFAAILAGATIFAALVIALALLTRRRRRHLMSLRTMRDAKQLAKLLSRCGSSKVTLFSFKELEKATKGFSQNQMLGHGGHGTVYRGKLSDGRDVAVKRINHLSSHGVEQVVNEVKLLLSVAHPNLVQLLGCCLEGYDPLLVYEFVPNGTLAEHLQRERGEGLEWFTRITIAAEAAQALAYLHSRVPPIYHRDVKSSNILLDFEFNTKVGDFGLSRLVLTEASHISTAPQGTPGYMDPEYHQSFQLSDKSDVYSFGVVLVEIITSMKVVDFTRDKREINLAALAISKIATDTLDEIIDPMLQEQSYKNPLVRCMIQRVAELAFRCLAYEKDARPNMMEVFEEVEGIKHACISPGDNSPIRDIKIDESLLIPR